MDNDALQTDCPDPSPRVAILACGVLEAEVRHFAADCGRLARLEIVRQELHNKPASLHDHLQLAIDRLDADAAIESIVLVYGLCSRATEGLVSRRCRLVMPRAHDCITLLLGSRHAYEEHVRQNPGTYWYSPGWNRCHTPPGPERHQQLRDGYLRKYDPETADYLMDQEQQWFKTYTHAVFVDLSVSAAEGDAAYTRRCADWLGWRYQQRKGDPRLLQSLISGRWDPEDFIVVEPGRTIRFTGDQRVVEAADVLNPPPPENRR